MKKGKANSDLWKSFEGVAPIIIDSLVNGVQMLRELNNEERSKYLKNVEIYFNDLMQQNIPTVELFEKLESYKKVQYLSAAFNTISAEVKRHKESLEIEKTKAAQKEKCSKCKAGVIR